MADFIKKAIPENEFNNGGISLGGPLSPTSGPESILSSQDQNDIESNIENNNNISRATKRTGYSATEAENQSQYSRTLSNDDEDGGCDSPLTRGSSRLLPNVLTITMDDENGGTPGIALFGYAPCDCYVPLNIPLLSLFGKIAKAGKISNYLSDLWKGGQSFQAILKWLGIWGKYTDRLHEAADAIYDWRYYQKLFDDLQDVIAGIRRNIKKLDDKINTLLAEKIDLQRYLTRVQNHIYDLTIDKAQALTDGNIALAQDLQRKLDASEILKNRTNNSILQNENLYQQNTIIRFQESQALPKRIADRDQARIDMNNMKYAWNEYVTAALNSDIYNLLSSIVGYSFEALAALDPSRKKVCLGVNTHLDKTTCTCVCDPNTATCTGGSGSTPLWSILDFVAPIQADEVKACYPNCGCNLERENNPVSSGPCECKYCKAGYTWKDGAGCGCLKYTAGASPGYGPGILPVGNYIRGTCLDDDKIAAEESFGKVWNGNTCQYECPAGTDVAESKSCNYGRLEDNLSNPNVGSTSHYLYTQGCNCECLDRDGNVPSPNCSNGYVFNPADDVCACEKTCNPGCLWQWTPSGAGPNMWTKLYGSCTSSWAIEFYELDVPPGTPTCDPPADIYDGSPVNYEYYATVCTPCDGVYAQTVDENIDLIP